MLVQSLWVIPEGLLLLFRVYLVYLAIYHATPQTWRDPRGVSDEVCYMFRTLRQFRHDLYGRAAIPNHGNAFV